VLSGLKVSLSTLKGIFWLTSKLTDNDHPIPVLYLCPATLDCYQINQTNALSLQYFTDIF